MTVNNTTTKITSATNPLIKQFIQYTKQPKKPTHCIINGTHLIQHITTTTPNTHAAQWNLQYVLTTLSNTALPIQLQNHTYKHIALSEHIYNKLQYHDSPQSLTAVFELHYNTQYNNLHTLKHDCNTLICDNIQNAANLGALLRTAAAMGYTQVICINCCSIYNYKCIAASMGAVVNLHIVQCTFHDFIQYVSEHNIPLVALVPSGGTTIEQHKQQATNTAHWIVVGNEAHGISDVVLKLCKHGVTIPIDSSVMNSLNASIAGGIAMYVLR